MKKKKIKKYFKSLGLSGITKTHVLIHGSWVRRDLLKLQ